MVNIDEIDPKSYHRDLPLNTLPKHNRKKTMIDEYSQLRRFKSNLILELRDIQNHIVSNFEIKITVRLNPALSERILEFRILIKCQPVTGYHRFPTCPFLAGYRLPAFTKDQMKDVSKNLEIYSF